VFCRRDQRFTVVDLLPDEITNKSCQFLFVGGTLMRTCEGVLQMFDLTLGDDNFSSVATRAFIRQTEGKKQNGSQKKEMHEWFS